MDPWFWTVDEVVENLCKSRNLFQDRPTAKIPDVTQFEKVLRQNDVDGATLLEHIDGPALRGDFGVASMGERAAILHAVEILRLRSAQYVSHKAGVESRQYKIQAEAQHRSSDFTPQSSTTNPIAAPETKPEPRTPPLPKPDLEAAEAHEPKPRPGEYVVTQGGVKRRRLQLVGPANSNIITKQPRPQKMAPTIVNHFLGHQSLSIDKIFYEDEGEVKNLADDSDSESSTSEFAFISRASWSSRGERSFVNRRINFFLQTGLKNIDKARSVRYPYPERLVRERNGWSATLFEVSHAGVRATKRDAALINLEVVDVDKDVKETNVDHSWDHLLSRYPSNVKGDKILPLYEESGSENEYDESLLDEIEREKEQHATSKLKSSQELSDLDVRHIVEEEIARFKIIWHEERLPRRQNSAWTIWKKEQGRHRSKTMNSTRVTIEQLGVRLEKLVKEICSEQWKKSRSLRKQCGCLQQTVEDQQDNEWKLKLLESAKPPPRVFKARPDPRPKTQKAMGDSDSGDSLATESDDLDDFIDVDDIEQVSSPGPSNDIEQLIGQESVDTQAGAKAGNNNDETESTSSILGLRSSADMVSHTSVAMSDEEQPGEPLVSANNLQRQESLDSVLGPMSRYAEGEPEPTAAKSADLIDLTMSSQSSNNSPTDDLFTQTERNKVENATNKDIISWDWCELDEQSDRKRIVLKHLQSIDEKLREKIQLYFAENRLITLRNEVQLGLAALKRRDPISIQLIKPQHKDTVLKICKLFACWNAGCHGHFNSLEIPLETIQTALKARDFGSFYNFIKSISIIANQSDSDDDPSNPSPRKRRVGKVLRNREAQALRQTARARRDEGEIRSLKLESQLASSDPTEVKNRIIVNTMKEDDEGLILLNNHIASKIKPHQIDGLRFLWREIVSVGQTSIDDMQGCLLAHTMGLGKTMQTISLLVTIAEAAASSNPSVVNQIPSTLRQSRTLIICPPGLIENWKDEFRTWVPAGINLGDIIEVSSQLTLNERLNTISNWNKEGGILIIGYHMFRQLVLNMSGSSSRAPLLTESEHTLVTRELQEGPQIIIADEAHAMKQASSKISVATSGFRTLSRIALTGSPLANNLEDYYTMIDWVAPGYLGKDVEFRANYKEPIEAGTWSDSTPNEQRKALKKLRALIEDIAPKVNRADITAIQHDIKPKTEFVIKLPLTKWQTKAYSAFVESVLSRSAGKAVQAKIFDWINFLALLCTHPSTFLEVLRKRVQDKHNGDRSAVEQLDWIEATPDGTTPPVDGTTIPVDGSSTPTGAVDPILSDSMLARQLKILEDENIDNIEDAELSYKTMVIREILIHSKAIGDRVLVFSQHLATLDYLQRFVKELPGDIKTLRLDGSASKVGGRVEMVRRFNSGEADVFLISTKAGGLGLNISGANRVILVDFSFNPSHEEQAVGRAYRIGQQKEVFVYHLVTSGTYEKTLHNLTIFKKQLASRVVDKKNPTRSASKGPVYLFEPRDVEQENLEDFKGKDEIMDRILRSEAGRFVRGLQTAETMHKESKEELTEEEWKEVREMIADDQLRKRNHGAWEKKQAEDLQRTLHGLRAAEQSSSRSGFVPRTPQSSLAQPGAAAANQSSGHRSTDLRVYRPGDMNGKSTDRNTGRLVHNTLIQLDHDSAAESLPDARLRALSSLPTDDGEMTSSVAKSSNAEAFGSGDPNLGVDEIVQSAVSKDSPSNGHLWNHEFQASPATNIDGKL